MSKRPGSAPPTRASKAQLESLKESARQAGRQLDREQEVSVLNVAKTLDEINEGEAFAHIDTRLSFMERQVERLTARRDEADRGLDAELKVMRARIEDALEAVGATGVDQRIAAAETESRLGQLVTDEERRATEALDEFRGDLVGEVQKTLGKLEKTEARLKGEMRAFQEGMQEQSRSLTETVSAGQADFEDSLTSVSEKVETQLAAAEAEQKDQFRRTLEDFETARAELIETVQAAASAVEAGSATIMPMVESRLDNERREVEAGLNEMKAEVRLQINEAFSRISSSFEKLSTLLDGARQELVERLSTSEAKFVSSATRLESKMGEQARQMAASEQEWSSGIGELDQTFADLKDRVEEFSDKLLAAESRRVGDAGSSATAIQELASRVTLAETRLRDVAGEATGRLATRVEMLASQVASISEKEAGAEESSGAVEYLSRRVGELAERSDEFLVKINAIGRALTKGHPIPEIAVSESMPAALADRMEALEQSIAAAKQSAQNAPAQTADPALTARLEQIEQVITQLAAQPQIEDGIGARIDSLEIALQRIAETPAPAPGPAPLPDRESEPSALVARIEALERALTNVPATLSSRQAEITERVSELERQSDLWGSAASGAPGSLRRAAATPPNPPSVGPSVTILPEKKKRGFF